MRMSSTQRIKIQLLKSTENTWSSSQSFFADCKATWSTSGSVRATSLQMSACLSAVSIKTFVVKPSWQCVQVFPSMLLTSTFRSYLATQYIKWLVSSNFCTRTDQVSWTTLILARESNNLIKIKKSSIRKARKFPSKETTLCPTRSLSLILCWAKLAASANWML